MKIRIFLLAVLGAGLGFSQGRLGSNVTIPYGTTPTTNTILKWNSSNQATNSGITDDGSTVTLGTAATGYNLTINSTAGTELITNFASWTGASGWTYAASKWSHATGNTGILNSDFSLTVGVEYQFIYVLAQSVAGTGVTFSAGGMTFPTSTAAGTYTYTGTASATNSPRFTPGSLGTWVGDVLSLSVKVFTNGNLVANGATFRDQVLGPHGNKTYPTYAFKNAPVGTGMFYAEGNGISFSYSGTDAFVISSAAAFVNNSTGYLGLRSALTKVYSDASNQWDFRNSTAAQRIRIHNTYTSETNRVTSVLDATATAFDIKTEHGTAGGGAIPITFTVGGANPWIMTPGGKFSNAVADTSTFAFNITGTSHTSNLNVGAYNTTAGIYASSFGTACGATGNYSSAFGVYALSGAIAEQSLAAFRFVNSGDAQQSVIMVGDTTQFLTTSTVLMSDGIGHTARVTIPVNSCNYFEALVVGKVIAGTDIGKSVAYKLTGVIDRGASTVNLYGLAQTVIYEHADIAASCDATAVGNDTNKSLDITVTHAHGDHTNVMYWLARIVWTHIGG